MVCTGTQQLSGVPRASLVPVPAVAAVLWPCQCPQHRSCVLALQRAGWCSASAQHSQQGPQGSATRTLPTELTSTFPRGSHVEGAHDGPHLSSPDNSWLFSATPPFLQTLRRSSAQADPSRATQALQGHFRSSSFGGILSQCTESPPWLLQTHLPARPSPL